jgi:hypothetical protein
MWCAGYARTLRWSTAKRKRLPPTARSQNEHGHQLSERQVRVAELLHPLFLLAAREQKIDQCLRVDAQPDSIARWSRLPIRGHIRIRHATALQRATPCLGYRARLFPARHLSMGLDRGCSERDIHYCRLGRQRVHLTTMS